MGFPLSWILADPIGVPLASLTVPLTVVCAKAVEENNSEKRKAMGSCLLLKDKFCNSESNLAGLQSVEHVFIINNFGLHLMILVDLRRGAIKNELKVSMMGIELLANAFYSAKKDSKQ